jgi:flagellar basal body P-ring formation protein FlgA
MLMHASKRRRLLPCLIVGGALSAVSAVQAESIQSPQSIRAAAEKFVRREMPAEARGIIVTAGELDARLRMALCAEPLKAARIAGAQLQVRMVVGVSCRRGAEWTVYVPVSVESEIQVFVLRAAAARGQRLTAADVVMENRRVSGLAAGYIKDIGALDRHTLSRPLPIGSVLTTDALTPDFIVHAGEQVTLVASTGGIQVRMAGRALADGRDGARIRVQNLESLKVVEGVVDAERVIHVTF